MQLLGTEAERAWLRSVCATTGSDEWTGFNADVGSDCTWILHAIYENPQIPWDITYRDLHRARLIERDQSPPSLVAEVSELLERVNGIGFSNDRTPETVGDWSRLRWSRLLEHLGQDPEIHDVPCFRSIPYEGAWPARLTSPREGSMDREQFLTLLRAINSESSGECDCFFARARLESGQLDGVQPIEPVTLGELTDRFASMPELDPWTPANIWPADHTWFVWTDWDLWGTKVSGTNSLIERLREDPGLETADLPKEVSSWTGRKSD